MSSIFVEYLLAAFLIGGVWVAAATLIAERAGSRLGGLIIGLPSTTVVSFAFIAASQSTSAAVASTTVFPLVYGVTAIMLSAYYAISSRRGFIAGLASSMLAWVCLASVIVLLHFGIMEAMGGYLLLFIVSLYVFTLAPKARQTAGANHKSTYGQLILRGVFSGAIVSASVLGSHIAGPAIGGALTALPASFIASLIILDRADGPEFARSAAKPMMLSGMLTSVAYGLSVRFLYLQLGVISGTVASFAIAIAVSVPAYYIIRKFG